MKKRLLFLVLMLFAAFGFVACDPANTDTTLPTVLEQAEVPTNLAIAGKVLSWSAVTGVTQYVVYTDGVERATVSATTYDFTALTGDRIIFQVVAVGGQGVQDSPKSASLAYIANPTQEIADLEAAMNASELLGGAPDGFADELVRKGVISEDFDSDYLALEAFMDAVQAAEGDFVAINAALTTFLAAISNYEAYISAFMIMLPPTFDDQIDSLNSNNEYWEAEKVDPYSWYSSEECQEEIDQNNAEIAQLEDIQSALETHSDEMTLAATRVMAYLMEVQGDITTNLLTNLQGIVDSETRPTSAEIIAVKDEAVNILLADLPSLADLTMVYDLMYTMEAAMTGTTNTLNQYANEMALQTRLGIELELRFLLSLNLAFIDEVFRIEDDSRSDQEMGAEMAIHFLQAFNTFETDQAALIASIKAVFSEAQEQAIFDAAMDSAVDMLELQGMDQAQVDAISGIIDDLTYAMVNEIGGVFDDQFTKLVDHLAATDGAVIRKIMIFQSIHENYYYSNMSEVRTYVNEYTGEEFANQTEFQNGKLIAGAQMAEEIIKLLDATVATVTETNAVSFLNLIEVVLPGVLTSVGAGLEEADQTALINAFKTAMTAQDANLLALFAGLTDYLIAEDITGDLEALVNELETHNLAAYGVNYMQDSLTYDQMYDMRGYLILGAATLNGYMTPARRTLVNGIVDQVFAFMRTPEFLDVNGITAQEVTDMETQIEAKITEVLSQVAVVAAYDYKALSPAQITEIENLMGMLG